MFNLVVALQQHTYCVPIQCNDCLALYLVVKLPNYKVGFKLGNLARYWVAHWAEIHCLSVGKFRGVICIWWSTGPPYGLIWKKSRP